jgi:ABC-type molybdate transport system substrate-binding protein
LGPIGYRTLFVWKLKEKQGFPGLFEALNSKENKISDHADHLAAILKLGEADYGFLYKTTCLQTDIRFIQLEPEINLSRDDINYSQAEVTYSVKKANQTMVKTVKGSTINYGLSIPDEAANPEMAKNIAGYLLQQNGKNFKEKGYIFYKPKFFGPKAKYRDFSKYADYAGEF